MSIGYTLGGWLGSMYERQSAVVFWGVCGGLAGVAVVFGYLKAGQPDQFGFPK